MDGGVAVGHVRKELVQSLESKTYVRPRSTFVHAYEFIDQIFVTVAK